MNMGVKLKVILILEPPLSAFYKKGWAKCSKDSKLKPQTSRKKKKKIIAKRREGTRSLDYSSRNSATHTKSRSKFVCGPPQRRKFTEERKNQQETESPRCTTSPGCNAVCGAPRPISVISPAPPSRPRHPPLLRSFKI